MNIFCLNRFKLEVEKLRRKNSYSSIELDIIEYFFNKEIKDLVNGVLLNASDTTPYIKKRLEGRGGFRLYFFIIIKNDSLYLMYVHPKSGIYGIDNISDEYKKNLLKDVVAAIENKDLFKVTIHKDKKNCLDFTHI